MLEQHKKNCGQYKRYRHEHAMKGAAGSAVLTSKQEGERRRKIAQTMRDKIAAEPWRKEKMRSTAKRSLAVWARSEPGRQKSSETAVRTSSRPEIQKARSERLKNWREKNPEKFFSISERFSTSFKSRPEEVLTELLSKRYADVRRGQQFLSLRFSNRSKRRQVDIMLRSRKVVVEYDGPYHFGIGRGRKTRLPLEEVRKKDDEYNSIISSEGWIVIRIGMKQYSQRRGGVFIDGCLDRIFSIVDSGIPGVYKIGKEYEGRDVSTIQAGNNDAQDRFFQVTR